MDLNTAIDVIESVAGFTDADAPVGEAWAVVIAQLKAAQAPAAVSERLPELRGMFERILCVARSSDQKLVGNIELADRLIKAVVSWSALPLPSGEVEA